MKHRLLILPLLAALSACGDGAAPHRAGKAAVPVPAAGRTAPLDADGLPLFRAGLWEAVERRGAESETRRVCRAAGVDPATRDFFVGPVRPGCVRSRGGGGADLTVSLQCKTAGMTIETTIQLSGDETQFRSSMTTTVTGPDGVPSRERVTGEARWLSACPAGIAVGEGAGDALGGEGTEIDP
jgi:hypothetical protein